MIDLTTEKPVRLTAASKTFADILPEGRAGSRTHTSTWFRWAMSGCRGVRLETVRCGAALCTTREAVLRFFARLSDPAAAPNTITPAQRRNQTEKADAELSAAGY